MYTCMATSTTSFCMMHTCMVRGSAPIWQSSRIGACKPSSIPSDQSTGNVQLNCSDVREHGWQTREGGPVAKNTLMMMPCHSSIQSTQASHAALGPILRCVALGYAEKHRDHSVGRVTGCCQDTLALRCLVQWRCINPFHICRILVFLNWVPMHVRNL